MQEHGYKFLRKTRIVHDWWDVFKEDVKLPNGKRMEYMYGEQRDGVIVLGLTDNKEVVMIEEYRVAIKSKILGIVAGLIEPGEKPKQAAAREFEEESGYKAKKLIHLTSMYPTVGMINFVSHVYFATGLKHVGQKLDNTEIIKVKLMPIEKFENHIKTGYIEGGMILAYYIAKEKGLI